MGTISDKLTYLDETRENIRQSINSIGGSLTNSDTFRSYSDAIDEIYDKFPKVEGEGSNITLENTMEASIKSELNGDTSQETTTGKNLFNNAMQPTNEGDSRAAVSTIDTGKRLDYLGSSSSDSYIWRCFAIMDLTNYVGKTIRFKCNFNASGNNKAQCNIGLCNADGTNRVTKAGTTTSGQTTSFVVSELSGEQTYLLLTLYANANGSIQTNDYVEYTNMILTIDNTDMTYEEYTGGQPSPNPDYPQPINVVSGGQEVDVVGKNLFNPAIQAGTYNQATYTVASDGLITQSASDNSDWDRGQKRNFYLEAGTYTIKIFGKDESQRLQLRNLTDNVDIIQTQLGIRTFTLDGTKLVALKTWGSSGYPVSYYIELEKGEITDPTYEQFKGQSYEINLGKNLWNNTISQRGGSTNRCDVVSFRVEPNTTYTFSTGISNIQIYNYYQDIDKNAISNVGWVNTPYTYTTPNNCYYIAMALRKSDDSALTPSDIIEVQLEKGSQATSYAPYFTPIELCKIGTYQDKIYKDSGKWYTEKKTNKIASYNGETITTDYISTTGELTTGATIYYQLATPTTTEITDTELIEQLEEFGEAKSYEGTTNINVDGDLPIILNVKALEDIFSQ